MKINGNPDGGGGSAVITGLSVSANGTYIPETGVDGFNPVEVSVNPPLQSKSVTVNGQVTADEGYYGLGTVDVSVPIPVPVTEVLSVSVNNTYTPGAGVTGFSKVVVDVPQSVAGFTEKEITEESYEIYNLSNSASFVHRNVFEGDVNLLTVYLPNASYVGQEAFRDCTNLTRVELTVCEEIGSSAFWFDPNLTEVIMPSCKSFGSTAFYGCNNLRSINLPICQDIAFQTFRGCSNMSYLSLPECRNIQDSAFQDCIGLSVLDLPNVEVIHSYAFYNCNHIEQISLPKCNYIWHNAFNSCMSLSQVYLPECTTIKSGVFSYCTALTYADLPKCSQFEASLFGVTPNLESISAPNVVEMYNPFPYTWNADFQNHKISVFDFPALVGTWYNGLSNLRSITKINVPILSGTSDLIPNGSQFEEVSYGNKLYFVPSYNSGTFSTVDVTKCSIYVDAAMYDKWVSANGWSSLSAAFVSTGDSTVPMLSLSDGLLYGKTGAVFQYFESNTSSGININKADVVNVSLPECILLNYRPFDGFANINTVYLPNCRIIRDSAFARCYYMTSISIPNCIFIGGAAFTECRNLTSLTLPGSTICKLNGEAFPYTTFPIYVPASLVDTYKVAPNWSVYSSRIFAIPE